jgi:hypothetical protein
LNDQRRRFLRLKLLWSLRLIGEIDIRGVSWRMLRRMEIDVLIYVSTVCLLRIAGWSGRKNSSLSDAFLRLRTMGVVVEEILGILRVWRKVSWLFRSHLYMISRGN